MENQGKIDLLLLGLTWLEEDRGGLIPRRAGMIFHTWRYLGVIGEGERRVIASGNASLINQVMPQMQIERGRRKPSKAAIEKIVNTTDKRFVVLAIGQQLVYARLLGRDGYYMLPSAAGMDYANSIARRYTTTKAQFLAAWEPARMQLGRQIGALKKRKGQPGSGAATTAGSSGQGGGGSLPPAKIKEDDWEW